MTLHSSNAALLQSARSAIEASICTLEECERGQILIVGDLIGTTGDELVKTMQEHGDSGLLLC